MDGRALVLDPQPADIQDRDGAVPVLQVSRKSFPFVERAFADMGYSGNRPQSVTLIDVEIVRKPYLSYAVNHGDFPDADRLWTIICLVVVASILIHGLTVTPAMRWLDQTHGRDA